MGMLQTFYPVMRSATAYGIDYRGWYEKGKRALLFDIDNTLVPHGAPADDKAVALFRELHRIGFRTCLISNNREPRVKSFADRVGAQYLWKAGKPSPRGYETACAMLQVTPEQTLFIGDQLFTDVWGAKRSGIRAILVGKIDPEEEIQIVLKRRLEAVVLFFYKRSAEYREQEERWKSTVS